jgi:ATP-dependent protease ClpP protease subunit
MFKVEKGTDKAVITAYGYVGGYYLDYRNISEALSDISRAGYKQVDIRMHTQGGSVIDGNLIYNFITSFKGRIDIYIDGIAASMGSIIALASDNVHIAENGFFMFHGPKASGYGTAKELVEQAKLLTSLENNFIKKLSDRTGKTPDDIRATYFDGIDHWIDADEAVALKLCSDKFTAKNGNLSFTKADAEREGLKGMFRQYTALLDIVTPIPEPDMKIVNMKLGLAEGASEQEAVTAIEATLKRAQDAEAALKVLQDKEKLILKAEVKTLLDASLADGKIAATGRTAWEAQFEKDHESAKALLDCVPKRVTAQSVVESGQKPADTKLLTMTYDELDKQGLILEMKAKFPEEYKELFKKEFGTYPNAWSEKPG